MANMTALQAASLAVSDTFLQRLAILLDAEAMVVLRESSTVANHSDRAFLALSILQNPRGVATYLAKEITFDTNLIGAGFSVDGSGNPVDSLATDAAIRSQIATNWNVWCGIPQP